jgi:hypothetical protein
VPGSPGQGVPVGGTAGQFLTKIDGTNYNTDWTTVNLSVYAVKANNLSDLTNFATARDNLNLGTLNNPTFAGLTLQGSGANVGQYTPTSLTLSHTTFGSFVIQPSSGITFPDSSVQTTAFPAGSDLPTGGLTGQALVKVSNSNYDADWATISSATTWGSITGTLSSQTDLQSALDGKASSARGLPAGGEDGQIIVKDGTVDYATIWTDNSAETLTVRATNKTGSTLNKGAVVRINGAQGQRPTIALAQGNSGASADGVIGILLATLANNATGLVCTAGLAKRLDTSAYTEGVKLFLSPSVAGGLTPTRPSAPDHAVAVGIVSHSSATTGSIEVNVVVGDHLEWLHDVLITTPTNGQVLKYDSATSLWVNGTDAVGAVTSVAGRTGAVVLSNTDISGLGSLAVINDAPSDGSQYARRNAAWEAVAASGASVTISATAPVSPSAGDLWLRSTDYRTFTWTGAQWVESTAGYVSEIGSTFETVSKNLNAYASTLAYSGGNLSSITYALGGGLTIVKTFSYTGSNLTSIVLSGYTPGGISLTKTLTYSSGNLVGITYS